MSDDDEPQVGPRGRIFGLFGPTQAKAVGLPLNMNEIMKAEETRLMAGVDDEAKALFMAENPLALSRPAEGETLDPVTFNDVAGLDDRILTFRC